MAYCLVISVPKITVIGHHLLKLLLNTHSHAVRYYSTELAPDLVEEEEVFLKHSV